MASKKTAFKAASQSTQKKKKRAIEQEQHQSQESRASNASSSENRATQETRAGGGRDIRVQNVLEDRRTVTAPKRSSAGRTRSASQSRKKLTAQEREELAQSKKTAKRLDRNRTTVSRSQDSGDWYRLPIGLGNDSIESFMFDSQDYVNAANDRLGNIRPGVDYHSAAYNDLTSSSESLRNRSTNIRAYLNTHRDQYSEEYLDEMMSYLDSFDEYAGRISRRAKSYEDLVNSGLSQNQFNAELRDRYYRDQYGRSIANPDQSEIERLRNYANTAWEQGDDRAAMEYEDQINWLSENTTGGRMWRYEQNNARIEEITRQLEEIERTYRPGETGVVNASREEMKSELISEKKNLETWNRQYERGEERGTDITNLTRNAPDFYEYSHADNYGDPNLDEIEADRARVYGIADQEGNVYIDDGSFTNMTPVLDGGPSPSPTTLRDFKDPLGAYLSWSDDQKSQYVQQPNTSYGAVADAGTSGNWDFVNDNELAVYYYYLNKGNLTAAQAYLRSLDGTLLDRAKNQLSEDIQNASAGELFIRNVISVPQQVVGGVAAFGGAIGNALRGEGFRSGNAGMWQFAAGQTRAETAGRIDDATGNKSLLGISLGDAYQASMSALDSIFGGTFAGKAYTVFMGMGAAAQKAEEAYLSGASDQEIVSTALIAGALEYLSEQIAWDKLVGTPTPTTAKKAVINALEQAGFEGTEEVVSSIGNNIADLLIMGDRSAFETTKRQLLAENPNMTDSDANFEALKMSLGDLWKDFVGGAISGLGMGGAESFFGAFSGEGYKQYRDAYKQAGLSLENSGATDAVIGTARVTSQEKTATQDKQNARDVSRAQKELSESASRAQALTERARAARYAVQSSNISDSGTASPYRSAVRDYYNQKRAQNLSDRAAVAVGRTVQLTSDTMDALNRADADNAKARDVRFFQGLMGISPAQAAQNAVSDESKRQGMEYVADESKRSLAVSDDGRAHDAQGNAITIDGVADVQDGKLMLATTDGEILPADLISYATPEEALVYETIQRMNVSKASAIALSEAYKAGEVSAQEFALGVNQAYNFGRIGVDMDKAISRSESFAANLTQQQRITAYRMGQIDAQTSFDAQQSAIDTRVANAAKSADVKIGKVIYEFDNSGFRMNEQQRQGVQIAKMVSALTGVDVHIFESYDRDGMRYYKDTSGNEAVAPNGFYSNGNVWVDINAGNNGQGIVGVTLAHEFTHFIQDWSQKKFKVLGDYVIRRFNESNVNVDALVRAQMEKTKRARGEVLSYDDAYAEVVADSMEQMFTGEKSQALEQLAELKKQDATLWGKIKEWFNRIAKRLTAIRKAYSDVDADNETAAVVRGIDNFVEQASKIFAEGLDEAGKNYMAAVGEQSPQTQTIYEGRDIDGDPGTHLMSDRSMVEAAGLYFDYNEEDGTFRVLDREGGTEVKSVTAEDIKASPLGAMIDYAVKTPSNPSGTISAADARKQYQFFSDLINMCIEKNDVAMVWETTGSLVFSAIKNNADPQYTKTIDFSTICKKTKQLINVMSETMKAKGRGLTRSEVENAYLQTGLAGEATPCPVCYVFSRWIGVGGILDQISEFQKRYGAMDESQLRGFMEDMDARIAEYYEGLSKSKKETLTGKNGQMKAGGVLSDMKSKATNAVNAATRKLADNAMYVADVEALDTLISQLDPNADAKQIRDAKKERRKTASKIVDNDALIRAYDDAVDVVNEYEAYQYLSRVMMQQTEDGTWVKREGFEPVPNDILFDLNRGDDFARNYPLAWGFRTGKGAAAGKAILPYSDARLGEIVQGIGYADISNIGVGEENMFLNGDTQAAQKRIDAARAKARAQNLLGGTRFQSTSDFRYEFGSDYLLSFLEMQAIGSKVQLYTKVIEAVDFFATMGADVNLSVMPLNDGYITTEDGTKKLVYSPVTGVNGEAAIKKAKEYDNVQLILVGISDEHIRLALSSEDVTFVIPFHGSGNSTEQIQRLMELVRENLDLTQARDYTAVQSDHVMEKRSAAQKAAWDLRVKILTGGAKNLSNAEHAVLDSNPFLSDLYDRFYVDESAEEYGVKLGSAQAAIVFPFEYWDKSLDYAHADENGERFKEYCRTLGLIPRFSGMNSSGENVGYGDFSNDPGYWKLLIDRKMYNNVYDADGNWTGYGTYHLQQPIDVSNFNVSLIDPKVRNALYSDVMSKDAKPEKTSIIAQAVIDNITADSYAQAAREEAVKNAIKKKQNQKKYSVREDSEGRDLSDGQEDYFAESAIRDKNGALQVMYHATDNEFTVFSREYLGENTDAWSEEALATTAHIGFWFNTQNLSQNGKALYARAEEVYLNVTNPYDAGSLDGLVQAIAAVNEDGSENPSEIGEKFRDWLEENGYDGVRLHDEEFGGTSVVALYPEQIKRVNNLNPTSDPDIRFSLRDTSSVDIATVEKENAQLREANEELRKQFQRTVGVQLDQKAIRKMARDLLKQYDSSYDVDTLTDNLSKVFDVVANGGLTWDEASNAVVDMCRKVLEESSSFDSELYEYDQPVREYLKNVRLEISDDMRGGIELVADNVAAYRRGLFGIVGTAKKGSGVSIDQMWREASEMFPAYFSEDIVNAEDQAERLYYLAQSLKRPNYFTNVYEQNIDAAAYDMMLQIGAKYLDVPQSKTFADKFAEKLEAARKASRDAIRQKAAELRAQQKTANRTEKRLDAKITQMAKVMAQIEARANRYQEQLATERETAKQRIRDIRAENAQEKRKLAEEYRQKNKEKLAELRENYNRNKLTRQISDYLSSIRKLFENGRGTANVKQGMRDTVQATLGAAEVLFSPDVKDGDLILNSQIPTSQDEQALIQRYRMLSRARGNYLDLVDRGIDVDANSKLAAKAQREMLKLNKQLTALGTLDRMRNAIFSQRVDSALEAVADAYALLDTSADGYISSAYDQKVADYLRDLKTYLKGQIIANMDNDQLKALRKGVKMVLHTIREQNAAFVSERRETVEQRSTDTMDEVTVANPDRQTKNTTLAGIRKALGWDNLKPFYAFERMQSPTLMRLFQNVRAGEDVWVVDVNEARDYFQNLARQYGYFDIDRSKRFTFTDKSGKAFELSIPQMMSLYAYSKRAAAMQHLENGGFVFDDNARLTDQKGKTKKNVAYNIKQAHVIDQSIVQDVVSELQKQNAGYLTFVDQMQSYLSKTMGAKGNEVSMKLYGVEMFGEEFYFPIITPGDNVSKPIVVNDTFKIKNSGFTQALNPNAVGTIVLSDFMDVWSKHINDMAMYHAFTLPLEDMNRVMNYRVRNENGVVTDSVRMRLTNAFTSDAVNYINQFMTDINNGIRGDNRETFVKRMLSGFKKAKVFVNASVVVQQYSAIVRALDVIDAKYFVGVDKQSIGKKWNEVKRFAPIAAVKEMGHFDTGISGSTEEYIQKRSYQGIGENVKAFFTDRAQTEAALSFAPEFADKIAWTQIWSACKRKAADLNPNLSGDALLQKAGEYFTDVIVRTQVYDSTLSKSGLMRSKSAFLNMATAFMAEPTTTLNMLQHSLSDAKMGKPRAALRTVGSVFGSVMLNALLASIVFAARDDDEDKTYLEKYFAAVTSDFLDGINPLTMAPIVKDAWSLLQGYDVERSDMTLMSDTISRIKSLVQTLSNLDPKAEGKELEEQNRELRNQVISAATAVSNLFGIPFDNVVRDIRALFNTFGNAVPIKDTNGEMIRDSVLSALQDQIPVWNWLKDAESTSDKLYDAIRDGNAEYFARLTRGYDKDSQTNSAIQRALKENEDRITEAAKARMEGRINDYKALVRQMVSEYGLAHAGETTVQDNIIKAINAVIRELENKPSDDSYKPTKQLKMDDYVTAMANGREKDANTARETIIQEMVDYDGKTQDKAEESFVSSAVSAARSRYEDGEISEQTALRIIMDAKDCSNSDAQYTMTMWELQRKNPDVSNGRIEKWYNDVKSSGISLAVYNDYAVRMAECKGVDSDGDGKADPNTAKDQKLAVIDSLPISNDQKDFLYRLNNWAESKLYQAPWH